MAQAMEEKRYGVITAPDRWMTSFTLPVPSVNLSVSACTCAQSCTCECAHRVQDCALFTVEVHVRLRAFIRLGECRRVMAGRHVTRGVPYSEPVRSVSHQTDYGAATVTALNGRNRTPFNEHTNLRNITLYSGI